MEEKYLDFGSFDAQKRVCFDWQIWKPIHLDYKNHQFCIGFDRPNATAQVLLNTNDTEEFLNQGAPPASLSAYLKQCDELEGYYDTWLYNKFMLHTRYETYKTEYCLTATSTPTSSASTLNLVTAKICSDQYPRYHKNPAQQWIFDSRGRFRNVMNGEYLSVEGHVSSGGHSEHATNKRTCNDVKYGSLLVTMNSSSIVDHKDCTYTRWLVSAYFTIRFFPLFSSFFLFIIYALTGAVAL